MFPPTFPSLLPSLYDTPFQLLPIHPLFVVHVYHDDGDDDGGGGGDHDDGDVMRDISFVLQCIWCSLCFLYYDRYDRPHMDSSSFSISIIHRNIQNFLYIL